MVKVTDTSQFPWLCDTTEKLEDDSSNIVCPNEKDTFDSATTDAYDKYGLKCTYYRVTKDLDRDRLFGEDQLRIIKRSWYFTGYVNQLPPNVRNYQLQGIWGEDTVTLYASIGAFDYYSTYGGYDKNTPEVYEEQPPSIGDIVYIEANNTFYRVVDVKYYEQAFGLKPHTYTLTLKVYRDNKWTVSADSPTLADTADPIYKVANYPMSSCYNIDDPLKNNPFVSEDAWDNPDPYNNINVLYDENAHARVALKQLQEDISSTAKDIAAGIAAIKADTSMTEEEAETYLKKAEDYREENDQRIENIGIDMTETKITVSDIEMAGKVIHDEDIIVNSDGTVIGISGDRQETDYYTKYDIP